MSEQGVCPMVMVRGQQALLEQSVCVCFLWRAGQQAVSEQGVCLLVMESRTAGCVRAKCVSDFYGEQDSRLCRSKVCA